jgi:hypothetical protein
MLLIVILRAICVLPTAAVRMSGMAGDEMRLLDGMRHWAGPAIRTAVFVGVLWHFGWRPSFRLDRENLLWFVAFCAIAVPVLVVEDRILKKVGPHEGFKLAAVFVHSVIFVIVAIALALVIRWAAGKY